MSSDRAVSKARSDTPFDAALSQRADERGMSSVETRLIPASRAACYLGARCEGGVGYTLSYCLKIYKLPFWIFFLLSTETAMNPPESSHKREAHGGLVWDRLLYRVAEKDHPTADELAAAVEHYGVPTEAACKYVARRLRDEVHLGDGGAPPANARELLWKFVDTQRLQDLVERYRKRYETVRVAKVRALDVTLPDRLHPPQHGCSKKLRFMEACPDCGRIRVLLPVTGVASQGWMSTKDGRFRIRAPKALAVQRVAVQEDIPHTALKRRLEEFSRGLEGLQTRAAEAVRVERAQGQQRDAPGQV